MATHARSLRPAGPKATRRGYQATERRRVTQRRTPIDGEMGGTQTQTTYETDAPRNTRNRMRGRPDVRRYNPARAGEKTGGGIGILEAEYFGCIFLIVLSLFTDSADSYLDKIGAVMKRGTLTSILFFVLAMIASVGPNISKVAKALGALVFVGVILDTNGTEVFGALNNFFKADWITTNESGTAAGSADMASQGQSANSTGSSLAAGARAAFSGISDAFSGNAPGAVENAAKVAGDAGTAYIKEGIDFFKSGYELGSSAGEDVTSSLNSFFKHLF